MLSLVDLPYNQIKEDENCTWPSMEQSNQFLKSAFQQTHLIIDDSIENRIRSNIATSLVDLALGDEPFSWAHEEPHCTPLSRRGSAVKNTGNFFRHDNRAVDVREQDLIRSKKNCPLEFVRMHSAGMESGTAVSGSLEKDATFYDVGSWEVMLLRPNNLSNYNYILMSASGNALSEAIEKKNLKETAASERDKSGADCLAWVYDTFRPEEPCEARGVHPRNWKKSHD